MEANMAEMAPLQRYRLLTGLIVPRPIALVTTLDENGAVNAAPFSFFNMLGSDPPIVALGIGDRTSGERKDTLLNILARKEFVVNLVSYALAEAMNVCGVEFPPDIDELAAAGLHPTPSVSIGPPRIAEAPASLECRLHTHLEVGRNNIILGEVIHAGVADQYLDGADVIPPGIDTIGRMQGRGGYVRTTDQFQMARMTYDQFLNRD